MDVGLHLRVLWRFKYVVALGLLLAIGLAAFSLVRVSFGHGLKVSYRSREKWQSSSTLFLTRNGFPWGQAPSTDPKAFGNADVAQYQQLAVLYSHLALSDSVKALISPSGRLAPDESLDAQPGFDRVTGSTLPLITITGIASTPMRAATLSLRAARAFETYLGSQQQQGRIPDSQRVSVELVQKPNLPTLLQGRSKTLPMVIFIAVMALVFGLAFLLENFRPRIRALPQKHGAVGLPASPAA